MLPGYLGKRCQLLDSPKADSKVKIRVTDLRGEGEPSMEVKKRWKGKEPTAILLLPLLGKSERSSHLRQHSCGVYAPSVTGCWLYSGTFRQSQVLFDPMYENTKS